MNCSEIKLHVHDYSEATLSPLQQNNVKRHLSHCEECRLFYDQHNHLRTALAHIPRPKASEEFRKHLLKQHELKKQQLKQQSLSKKVFATKFSITGVAIAASIVFSIVLSTIMNNDSRAPLSSAQIQNQTQIVAALNEPSQVNFLVNAKHAIDDVIFSLNVPPELELYGYTGQQTLSWSGKLKKGNNLLTIPVVALTHHSATLVMEIKHNDAVKEYKVLVDVKQNNVGTPNTTIIAEPYFMLS